MVVIAILIDLPLDDRAGLGDYMQFSKYTHTHTHTLPREDQCERHRMTKTTGPNCAVM